MERADIDAPVGAWTLSSQTLTITGLLVAAGLHLQGAVSLGTQPIKFAVSDIVVWLPALITLVLLARSRLRLAGTAVVPVAFAVFAFTIVLAAGLIIGRINLGSWTTWALVGKFGGWFLLLAYLATGYSLGQLKPMATRNSAITFISVASLIGFVAICASFWFVNTRPPWTNEPLVAAGGVGNANSYGLLLCTGLVLLVALPLARTTETLVAAIVTAILLTAIGLSGSRTSAAVAMVVVLASLLRGRRRILAVVPALAITLAIVAGPQLIGDKGEATRNHDNTADRFKFALDYGVRESGIADRLELTREAIHLWRTSPVVGSGLGVFLAERTKAHPDRPLVIHNTALWILTEMGLIGLAVFMALFIAIARALWRSRRAENIVAIYAGIGILFAAATFSLLHEIMYQRVIWFVLGIGLGAAATATASMSNGSPAALPEPCGVDLAGDDFAAGADQQHEQEEQAESHA